MTETTRGNSLQRVHGQLGNALIKALPPDLAHTPCVIFCDRDEHDEFDRFAGLARIRAELEHGRQQSGGAYPPILLLGLSPAAVNGASPQEKELAALLRWPGIAYLPYGFTKEYLIVTARKSIEGAKAPMPPGVLPTPEDILCVASEVRHWLENRLRNTEGALIDCRNAAKGDVRLHPAYLEPMAAISRAHREMLDRLWALEPAAERFAPRIGGLAPIKVAIAEFETYWQELEAVRAEIRSRDGKECAELLDKAGQDLKRACSALATAIAATNGLSSEITTMQGR